jgi:hypothetical protein
MHPTRTIALALVSGALAACATTGSTSASRIEVPAALKTADNERFAFALGATGVQIYECRVQDGKAAWAFVAPEADLLEGGKKAGIHYAGPTWEVGASKIVGTVKSRADAPRGAADIPWLLLATKSTGGPGRLAEVTSIQRVKTVGGVAPASGCNDAAAGKRERVPYTADYYFFVGG